MASIKCWSMVWAGALDSSECVVSHNLGIGAVVDHGQKFPGRARRGGTKLAIVRPISILLFDVSMIVLSEQSFCCWCMQVPPRMHEP